MSSPKAAINRLRRSVAVRLSVWFALLFTVGFTALFGLLYWLLSRQLELRERDAVTMRLHRYVDTFYKQGTLGLGRIANIDRNIPGERLFMVRIFNPNGNVFWQSIPDAWIDPDAKNVTVPDGWGGWTVQQVFSWRVPNDDQKDLIGAEIVLPNGQLMQLARITDNHTWLLEPLRRTYMWVAIAVVVFGFVAGALFARRAVRPLQGVVDTARRIIATGALDARVAEPKSNNDIAELVRLFNTVLDKNAALLRSMREALDNVAHDLRTPLTSMRGSAELALTDGGEPAMRDALAENVERSDEVLRLLRALMEISEADSGVLKLRKESCDLALIAADAASLYTDVADARAQTLVNEAPAAPVFVSGDSTRLRQVVVNLIDNALKYTPDGGRVVVSARPEAREDKGEGALLTVRDNGPGVPEAEQSRIWERLYRCDQSRSQSGLGLGLSLVRAIVEAHGGTAAVRNAPGGGAVFEVWLPRG